MGPKVAAACQFVTATGCRAAIGGLDDAVDVIAGRTGTQVHRSES
jgi:carbamate kinase